MKTDMKTSSAFAGDSRLQELQKLREALRERFEQQRPGQSEALVYGEGPINPRLMLIGEAPGEQETLMHRPFVGKAGKNLDHFLMLSGLLREEIYITNVVKIRPTKQGKSGRVSNRPPNREELAFFIPELLREIELVGPEMIAVLGNTPLHALAGKGVMIGEVHGRFVPIADTERTCFALYHPASLIYNPGLREVYEADIRTLAETLSQKSDGSERP